MYSILVSRKYWYVNTTNPKFTKQVYYDKYIEHIKAILRGFVLEHIHMYI
jgi:hypothetical protein